LEEVGTDERFMENLASQFLLCFIPNGFVADVRHWYREGAGFGAGLYRSGLTVSVLDCSRHAINPHMLHERMVLF
jgi:hypothetical protein